MADAKIFMETERLLLRELVPEDAGGMFELDSDAEVHRYIGKNPVKNIERSREVIDIIREQYITNGIGRWAVIEKETGLFIGWSGLKLTTSLTNGHINYYDLGYRFIKKHWGKGYATETAVASVDYGFNHMGLTEIYGMADIGNIASQNVLQKAGLQYVKTFEFDGAIHKWYKAISSNRL
ncbi:MAG: GNAT family N-acetyltransferase [Flavipsychrobacter sp.]|nr:GNAT family N-acetyltransferase [Flavipsychrobacter sp.]